MNQTSDMLEQLINTEQFDFYFMNEFDERHMRNGCRAIDSLNLWEWLRNNDIESFMTSTHSNVMKIYKEMETVEPVVYHSGCSFVLTMRLLESFAKKGYMQFKKEYLENS